MDSKLFKQNKFFEQYLITEFEVLDKTEFFCSVCHSKKVLHIGCCDWPIMDLNDCLHSKLIKVSREIVGIDTAIDDLNKMRKFFNDQRFESDLTNVSNEYFDVVIIPDVLEHVSNQGFFLENVKGIKSPLFIFSTPNAFSAEISRRLSDNIEEVHPDHKCYYSPYTLYNVLKSNGFTVYCLSGYDSQINRKRICRGEVNPLKSHGIIAVCGKGTSAFSYQKAEVDQIKSVIRASGIDHKIGKTEKTN